MTIITHKFDVSRDGAVPGDALTKKAPAAAKIRPGALAESGGPTLRPPSAADPSDEKVAKLGRELDAIRDDILAKRGAADAAYIRRMMYTPPLARQTGANFSPRPQEAANRGQESGRISRRSCHYHNPGA
jgi:hypothetical protein